MRIGVPREIHEGERRVATTPEVATQLHLAEKTVAAHLSNIYGKVEVKSRLQLASWLEENDAIVA